MKYRYFNPDEGETIDDAEPVVTTWFVDGGFVEVDEFTNDVETAAEVAAEQYQPYAEWYEGSRTFAIVDEQNNVVHVSVELEYAPVYTGHVL
jgi:hypothetical protein